MGNSSSSALSDTFDEVNNNLTTLFNDDQSESNVDCSSSQTLNFTIGSSSHVLCTPNVTQVTSLICDLTSITSSSNTANLTTQLQQAVNQAAASSNTAVSGFLSTAVGNSSSSKETIATHIVNNMATYMTNINSSTCSDIASAVQNATITLDGWVGTPNTVCNFGQNLQLTAMASCVTNNVSNSIAADSDLTTALQTAEATNTSGGTGPISEIGSAISSILDSLFTGPIIIIAAIVIVIVIVLVCCLTCCKKKK
jgi:hypothetical protein